MALTEDDARNIRESYEMGFDVTALAQDFEASPRTIRRILRGETFKSAGGPIAEIDSSRIHPITRAAIVGELGKPYWRGRDTHIMEKYGISYEILRDIKEYVVEMRDKS